jgi:uncharacterized protein YjiS (DUF1127 family)
MRSSAIQRRAVPAASWSAWRLASACAACLHFLWRACHAIGWHIARQRTRRALACLDGRMLSDIGITRAQAIREAGKAPWSD